MITFRFWVAFAVAPAVSAAVFCVYLLFSASPNAQDLLGGFLLASVVTYAHAILLGVPAMLVLGHMHRLTRLSVLVASFLIGVLPVAILISYSEITTTTGAFSVNGVWHRIGGRLTLAGWISNVEGILLCGVLGLVAGIFLWSLSGASANNALEQTRDE